MPQPVSRIISFRYSPFLQVRMLGGEVHIKVNAIQADLYDAPLSLHGVSSVGAQVHYHLMHLGGIGHDVTQLGFNVLANLYGSG